MRSSDWSSDVCSSDLVAEVGLRQRFGARSAFAPAAPVGRVADTFLAFAGDTVRRAEGAARRPRLRQPAGTLGLRRHAADPQQSLDAALQPVGVEQLVKALPVGHRSEEHTSELQSLMRISYAV